mmetsp:Transcript_40166/g.93339  ORF Transcript_40166/g.93339 Transcript_40166/m.93339 type:complete len:217 (-) Transcript_40166:137-787(-)
MLTIGPHLASCNGLFIKSPALLALGLLPFMLLANLLLEVIPHLLLLCPLADARVGICLALERLEARWPQALVVNIYGAVLLQAVGVTQRILPPGLLVEVSERELCGRLVAAAHSSLLQPLQVVQHMVLQQLCLGMPGFLLHFGLLSCTFLPELCIEHGVINPELSFARIQELRAPLHLLLALPHDPLGQVSIVRTRSEIRVCVVRPLEARPASSGE